MILRRNSIVSTMMIFICLIFLGMIVVQVESFTTVTPKTQPQPTAFVPATTDLAEHGSSSCLFAIPTAVEEKDGSLLESTKAMMEDTNSNDNNKKPIPDNVILFDGVCNFCNTWVDILLRLDQQQQQRNAKFYFTPLQSPVGKELLTKIGKDADDISSVVLVKHDGSYYDKSSCVLQVLEEVATTTSNSSLASVLIQPLVAVARNFLDQSIRDGLYDMVAENRYNFMGKRTECRCSDPRFADRFL